MKKILRLSFAIIGLIAILPSCVKVETSPYLSVIGPTGIELSAEGSSGTITFTANRDWTISWSDSWISISPASGQASDEPVTITASCGMNTTYEDRNATATIKMGEMTQTINIRQLANLGIVLPSQSYDLLSDSRTIEIEVQANVLYSVTSSVDWIQQTGTKALSSKTLIFSIKENTSYDAREGKITLKPQDNSVQEKIIIVRQAQKNALNVNRTSFDMPYGGGEFEIGVETNVPFDVKTNEDWIHYTKTKALSNPTVVMTVDENPTSSPRSGKVEIVQQNGTLARTINVTQAGRIAVSSIELDETSLTLKVGDTKTLVATVNPENASDKTITWTSSNPDVASVDEGGTITAIEKGIATITAKAGDKSASCNVTVMREIPVSSVELDAKTLSLVAGDQVTLTAIISPEDATDKTVIWSSSDSNIASVDSDGKVTAISKGNTVITATSGSKFARCRVYVKAKHYDVPSGGVDLGLSVIWGEKNIGASSASTVGGYYLWGDPTGNGTIVYFNAPNLNSIAGTQYDIATSKMGSGWRLPTRAEIEELFSACSRTFTAINNVGGSRFSGPNGNSIYIPLSGMGFPSDGAVGNYSISSRDKGYIMSGESYKDGNDRFAYVYYFEGISYNWVSYNAPLAKFPVRPVYEKLTDDVPVTSVSLNKTSLSLKVGESETLSVIIRPSNATDKTVIWTTSDSEVATVDSNGNVTAKKVGSATISATAGGRVASCSVEVNDSYIAVTDVTLNKTTLSLKVGESETLIATVTPDNATDKTVAWSSSNTGIATVDSKGKVTAISSGTATITAKAGEKSTTCSIAVSENVIPVTAITLNKTTLPLQVGQSETLVATVEPDNATDKTVAWSSDDTSIVTVDDNGRVTAIKVGTASVSASAGSHSASCEVTVSSPVPVDNIVFADENLKARLVAAFDTNGDGELSYEEAAGVRTGKEITDAVGDERSFNSFDEFQFFSGIDCVVYGMFQNWNLKSIVLPGEITKIDGYAFYGCRNLETVVLNEGLRTIGQLAFYGCPKLVNITIPTTVNVIDQYAFYECSSLRTIDLPKTEVRAYTFFNCKNLESVNIRDVSYAGSIDAAAFYGCEKLEHINIPTCTINIYGSAFSGCSSLKTDIKLECIRTLGDRAFYNCSSLTSIDIVMDDMGDPSVYGRIGAHAFSGCANLVEATISANSIHPSAFADCAKLKHLSLANRLRRIWDYAFYGCTSLEVLIIPQSIDYIDDSSFRRCSSLTSITVNAVNPPTIQKDVFTETNNCPIYVPAGSVDAYKSADLWSDYADRIKPIQSNDSETKAVDLGLSVKWASCNIGATKPEEFGDFYAWGETKRKDDFNWSTYKFGSSSSGPFSKYNTDSAYGPVDNKNTLDSEDDVAHVILGGKWRMPTDAEWTELREKCTWSWTGQYGVNGITVIGPNGNSIFLPAAGKRSSWVNILGRNEFGYYWSSSLSTSGTYDAWSIYFDSGTFKRDSISYRYYGYSIRPVSD